MTGALVLIFVVAVAVIAMSCAGQMLAYAWRLAAPREGVHPWAAAAPRMVLLVPVVAAVVALTALLPSDPMLWLGGSCACDALGGVHVCPLHLSRAGGLVAGAAAISVGIIALRIAPMVRAWQRARDLELLAGTGNSDDDAIVQLDDDGRPLVFVAGLRRPRLVVERTWWSTLPSRERAVIAAHEGSHIAARDPWRMTLLDLALSLVAPAARASIMADWVLATEIRADAAAAARDGDATYVAEVLCKHARAVTPAGALGFGGRSLQVRVCALLSGSPTTESRRGWWAARLVVVATLACLGGHVIHRIFEAALGVASFV